MLGVAPTRALVADLTARLEAPLARIGWRCGAQTSDFAGAESAPEILITTPESLDSMLVRRFWREDGKVAGHLLSGVSAVFVDAIDGYSAMWGIYKKKQKKLFSMLCGSRPGSIPCAAENQLIYIRNWPFSGFFTI